MAAEASTQNDQASVGLRENFQEEMRQMLDIRPLGHIDGIGADGRVADMWTKPTSSRERKLWDFGRQDRRGYYNAWATDGRDIVEG